MEMRFHGAAKSARRGHDEDGEDSRRGTLGDARDHKTGGALQLPPGTNRAPGETLCGAELEVAHRAEEQIERIQRGRSGRQEVAALKDRIVQGTVYERLHDYTCSRTSDCDGLVWSRLIPGFACWAAIRNVRTMQRAPAWSEWTR